MGFKQVKPLIYHVITMIDYAIPISDAIGGMGVCYELKTENVRRGFCQNPIAQVRTRYSGHHFSRLMRGGSNKRQRERPAYCMGRTDKEQGLWGCRYTLIGFAFGVGQ